LNDAAKLNRIDPKHVDSSKGILFGWSRDFQTEAVIAMTEDGLQLWYQHNLGECRICPTKRQCRLMLFRTAENLGVQLSRQERRLDPTKLSSLIFTRAPGLDGTDHDAK
jgi:hypothetical protein